MLLLYSGTRTVSIELDSEKPFYNEKYNIFLNGSFLKTENRNVFTLYHLLPDTEYHLEINGESLQFKTSYESVFLNVKRFGAIGDGIADDTPKIQAALLSAPKNATVYIPKGTYLVGALYLKSDITLYLEKGAKLIAKTERKEWPIHSEPVGIWEGTEQPNFASVLNVLNSENVTITGEGEIDGQAELGDWYINHRVKNIAWRGHLLFTENSSSIHIIGLYFHNSPSWTIHPYMSNDIDIINVKITNKTDMPTTDGIDPDCVNGMRILGSEISVGDDCISIKSGTFDHALKHKKASSSILIRNNLMQKGHGGVVFGSELSGGINNITVTKCIFQNTDRGLRIKTRRGRGHIGTIDNIQFNSIKMENVKTPFVINMYYNMGDKGGHEEYAWTLKKLPFDEKTPVLGHFLFENMECTGVEYAAGVFLGLPESEIQGITLKNIRFSYNSDSEAGYPVMIEHNIKMKNRGLCILNCADISLNNITFNGIIGNNIERLDGEING